MGILENNEEAIRKMRLAREALLELIMDKQASEDLWYPDKGTLDDFIIPSHYYYNLIRLSISWSVIVPYDNS